MSGARDLLQAFIATLQPLVLGQVVECIFARRQLAGEASSLLKVEAENKGAA
jgi:hypothetical protein